MNLNIVELNCLSRIIAEELKKRRGKSIESAVVEESTNQSHLTQNGGETLTVTFKTNLYGAVSILRWYNIHPSKLNNHVVVYPHHSQAEIISHLRTIEEYERYARQIATFKEDNSRIQQYLESISGGIETNPDSKDIYWIIDPVKIFS